MEPKQSAFQTPITICDTVNEIHSKKYLLPAIQREFVWKAEQIIKLFDSLLQGYPIGTFLFWKIDKEKMSELQFYEFIREYHARDFKHNPKANITSEDSFLVVLDGQQRMAALYIGLRGTYTLKIFGKRWGNADAFPCRKLYLNLLATAEDSESFYDFAFLTDSEAKQKSKDKYWFEVGSILSLKEESEVNDYLLENNLMALDKFSSKFANKTLFKLHSVIHKDRLINYYLEYSQELDKVLNIFIRINSGGTQLSYSDLLLSIAAKQWKSKDAREEIASFVDDINDIGERECFDFDKDFVLKSCLVLSDLSEIAFKVDNFSMTNMNTIEKKWDEIKKSIKLAVELCSSFGYTRQTLTSVNAIIPLAYYIMKIGAPDNFVLSTIYQNDHKKIKKWLIISLIKRVFSGQPENVFRPIRKIMSEQSEMSEFPLEAIIDKFKGTTKTITFTDDDIDSLLNSKYGQGHTFSVLAILYPTLDYRNRFHQDHIFPKSWFKQKKLDEKNIGPQKQEFYLENMNYISNLQLLEGNPNLEKSNKDLEEWLPEIVTTSEERKEFLKKHYFPEEASLNFNDFELFINPSSIVKCNT